MNLFIIGFYVEVVVAENLSYRHSATSVLTFVKKEYNINELPIISFDMDEKIVKRIIYYFLSSRPQTEEGLMLSVRRLNSTEFHQDQDRMDHGNVLAISSFNRPEIWDEYLKLMAKTEMKSSILMFVGQFEQRKWENFIKMADNLAINSLFYVVFHKNNYAIDEMAWYCIMTIKGYKKSVVNRMEFDSNGLLLERYDMQGTHIISITLSWAPYFTLLDCKEDQQDCSSEGYLTDGMNTLGSMMNFTWESHGEIDGNWGTTVISGPSNSSGVWGGVVGSVFNGSYQLSIR